MLDKIERIDKPFEENTKMNLLFKPKIQSGNDVLSVKTFLKVMIITCCFLISVLI